MEQSNKHFITKEDIFKVKIISYSHPNNWYAKYVNTDTVFKVVKGNLDDGTPIYNTFFEGLMDRVDGNFWKYEDCLHANYITPDNAEIVQ